jgi:hypothetical protein
MPLACEFTTCFDAWTDIAHKDIKIKTGDDVVVRFVARDSSTGELIDWTGWSFVSLVKNAALSVTWATGIVTGDAVGVISILYPKAQTNLLTPDAEGKYDVEGTDPDGFVHTLVEGDVLVTGDVS